MATISLVGVLLDGSVPDGTIDPKAPSAQPITWPRGQGGTIAITVMGTNGTAVSLTGKTLALVARRYTDDTTPALSIAGVVAQGGASATFTIAQADVLAMVESAAYWYDVWLTASSVRSQIVPASQWVAAVAIGRPGEPA